MGYRVEVRDKELNRIGEIDTWIKLDFAVRFCQQGSWQLLVKAGTEQAELLQRGGGVAIYQDGVEKPLLTGQIESFQKYWTVEQHTAEGSVYVGGKCDNKLAFSRLAWPDPSVPIPQQYTARDTRKVSDSLGEAIWWELDKAIGPGALANREVPGINIGTPQDIGPDISDTLRYEVIGEKLAEWVEAKGRPVGYRLLWNPDTKKIELDVFETSDKSDEIRFSPELGNLREFIWTLSAPRVTRAIVACQGEGKERYIYQKIDSQSEGEWGLQIETFIDRRDLPLKTDPSTGNPIKANAEVTDDEYANAILAVQQAADAALLEGEKNGNFQIYPIDTDQIKFGRDYFVGDFVTVEVDGTTYKDIVREVTINVEDGGKTLDIRPKIGEQGTGEPLNLYRTVFEMREKLRKLEARM